MQPTYYIPHGGGPCFFMEWDPADTWNAMRDWLSALPSALPQKPKGIVIISAHWEEEDFTVSSTPSPALIYDYYGFPQHTYALTWPATGDATLSARVSAVCRQSGIDVREDTQRGYDHGVFVPLKVAFPAADIPVVCLSLRADYDPAAHLALGRALMLLRQENILIIGSGMSFHNLRAFRFHSNDPIVGSEAFDTWLTDAVTQPDVALRQKLLQEWESAPYARFAHPQEDHLIPLMVVVGAARNDSGSQVFHDRVMGAAISAYRFG